MFKNFMNPSYGIITVVKHNHISDPSYYYSVISLRVYGF